MIVQKLHPLTGQKINEPFSISEKDFEIYERQKANNKSMPYILVEVEEKKPEQKKVIEVIEKPFKEIKSEEKKPEQKKRGRKPKPEDSKKS